MCSSAHSHRQAHVHANSFTTLSLAVLFMITSLSSRLFFALFVNIEVNVVFFAWAGIFFP